MINPEVIQLTLLQEDEEETLATSMLNNWHLRSGAIYWRKSWRKIYSERFALKKY